MNNSSNNSKIFRKSHIAQSKWYPVLYPGLNTTLYDMMASPLKKTIIHLVIGLLFLGIILVLLRNVFEIEIDRGINIMIVVYVILLVFSLYGTFVRQYQKNDDLVYILKKYGDNAKIYDYENDPVIQSRLYRSSFSRGSSLGSDIMGDVIGSYAATRIGQGGIRRRSRSR